MEDGTYFNPMETQQNCKGRKKYRSAFLSNLFKALESGKYSELLRWSTDGVFFEMHNPYKIAQSVFPQIYKHSNLSSFTRQLNMYQFQRVRTGNKASMVYYHPMFQRGRADLVTMINRLPVGVKKISGASDEAESRSNFEIYEQESFETNKKVKTSECIENKYFSMSPSPTNETSVVQEGEMKLDSSLNFQNYQYENLYNMEPGQTSACIEEKIHRDEPEASDFSFNFQLLVQIASNSQGYRRGSSLPDGFDDFQKVLEKMLGFDEIDKLACETLSYPY